MPIHKEKLFELPKDTTLKVDYYEDTPNVFKIDLSVDVELDKDKTLRISTMGNRITYMLFDHNVFKSLDEKEAVDLLIKSGHYVNHKALIDKDPDLSFVSFRDFGST